MTIAHISTSCLAGIGVCNSIFTTYWLPHFRARATVLAFTLGCYRYLRKSNYWKPTWCICDNLWQSLTLVHLAWQALEYVSPSSPHTGSHNCAGHMQPSSHLPSDATGIYESKLTEMPRWHCPRLSQFMKIAHSSAKCFTSIVVCLAVFTTYGGILLCAETFLLSVSRSSKAESCNQEDHLCHSPGRSTTLAVKWHWHVWS